MNDRFEMRGEIGAGGRGVVYRVFDLPALAREFPVLQRLPTGHAPILPGMPRTPAEARRFASAAVFELCRRIAGARPMVMPWSTTASTPPPPARSWSGSSTGRTRPAV